MIVFTFFLVYAKNEIYRNNSANNKNNSIVFFIENLMQLYQQVNFFVECYSMLRRLSLIMNTKFKLEKI